MDQAKIKKFYFVTEDLCFLICQWCDEKNYDPPSSDFFRRLRDELCQNLISLAFSEPLDYETQKVEVEYVKRGDLTNLIKDKEADGNITFWITLDDVYVLHADYCLQVTRIFDSDGKQVGIGRRPEAKDSLHTQIEKCKDIYEAELAKKSDLKVVLADDGAFSGGSIVSVLKMLRSKETKGPAVCVSEIRLGFCTVDSFKKIGEFVSGEEPSYPPIKYYPYVVISQDSLVDWVCERDFYIGAPRSGRTFGQRRGERPQPIEPPIGLPYLYGWGDIEGGAMIARGKREFSAKQTDASIRLWLEIEKLNGTTLNVQDLPRFPGPGLGNVYHDVQKNPLIRYLEKHEANLFSMAARKQRQKNPWPEQSA